MSDLVEKVARALRELADTDPTFHTDARAAIAAVAEWLQQDCNGDAWDWRVSMKLEKQPERPK